MITRITMLDFALLKERMINMLLLNAFNLINMFVPNNIYLAGFRQYIQIYEHLQQ